MIYERKIYSDFFWDNQANKVLCYQTKGIWENQILVEFKDIKVILDM